MKLGENVHAGLVLQFYLRTFLRRFPLKKKERTNLILVVLKDEEEVPPESGTEGKEKDDKEEAEKEKQDESEKNEAEEKNQKPEETGSKTDPKVRAVVSAEQGFSCTALNEVNERFKC